MNIDKGLTLIYEQILLEYSQGFIYKETQRLKKMAGNLVDVEAIKSKINRFDQLKTGGSKSELERRMREWIDNGTVKAKDEKDQQRIEKIKKNPLMIELYSWEDLEKIVDSFPDPNERKAQKEAVKSASSTGGGGAERIHSEIADERNLEIYFSPSMRICIAFKHYLYKRYENDKPKPYSWCIAYDEESRNLYNSYRYGVSKSAASVYFVIDNDIEDVNDERAVSVIMAQRDGKFRYTNRQNDMSKEFVGTWEQVVSKVPKLEGLKELFEYHELTEDEQILLATKNDTAKDFRTYTSERVKKAFITSGKQIFSEDYLKLDANLQHMYVNIRVPVIEDQNWAESLTKLTEMFADNDRQGVQDRMDKALELGEEGNSNWIAPILDDPIVKQSKNNQTYKYWCRLIEGSIKGMAKLRQQKQEQ